MKRTILIALLLLWVPAAFAADRLVPSQYPTIRAAINDCNDGDTVIVADGVYTETGNGNIDFYGKAITVRSENGPNNCIIDCYGAGRGFYFHNEEDSNSILDGFTITNGFTSDGGGIYCQDGASPTITNCTISGNSAREGGGICIHDHWCNPTITNCTISGNSAAVGGGICCKGNNSTITDCTITNNSASRDGGGIYYISGSITIINCTFNENSACFAGGGIYGPAGGMVINCTFTGNSAQDGGGSYCISSQTIINCTFTNNNATNHGGGVCSELGPSLVNCILWSNADSSGTGQFAQVYIDFYDEDETTNVAFSCIQDDDPNDDYIPFGDPNSKNIDDNPVFVRDPNDGGDGWGDDPCTPDINEAANDDFGDLHLQPTSPCIEAGNPLFVATPNSVDMDGQLRLLGSRVDIGADEFAPVIAVTKPEGGEVWVSGSRHPINWVGYGISPTVDISYSGNNGADWIMIENNVPDTGTYFWHLPDIVDSNQCLISIVPTVPEPNVACVESGLFTIHPVSPDPATVSKWRTLGGNFKRTGLSENYGPELGCIKWVFETNNRVSSSVTIGAANNVHIACEDGKLYTLDSNDGSLLWNYDTNSPLLSSPTVGPDGTLYVGSQNGKLYVIDTSGNLRWIHNTNGFIYSSPAVSDDGKVYLCSQDGTLYALATDGSELWTYETKGPGTITSGSILASPAIAPDGTIYIGGLYDPNLYAIDSNDGTLKCTCNFEFPIDPCNPQGNKKAGWPFASPVIAEDGTIYQTLLYDPNLYAIEPNTGNIIWSTHLADPCSGWFGPEYLDEYTWADEPGGYIHSLADGWSEPALGPDGTIYVSFDDPYLRAVDPNGDIKWVTRLGMMGGFTLAVGSDGFIYAACDDGYLCVVNPDGQEIARFQTSDWLSFPVISADDTIIVSDSKDNTLLISDANNTVWAIGSDGCQGRLDLHRPYDISANRIVDFTDFAMLAADWLLNTDSSWYYSGIYLTGDIDRNLYVDYADLEALADNWLNEE